MAESTTVTVSTDISKILSGFIEAAKKMPKKDMITNDQLQGVDNLCQLFLKVTGFAKKFDEETAGINMNAVLDKLGHVDKDPTKSTGMFGLLGLMSTDKGPILGVINGFTSMFSKMSLKDMLKSTMGMQMLQPWITKMMSSTRDMIMTLSEAASSFMKDPKIAALLTDGDENPIIRVAEGISALVDCMQSNIEKLTTGAWKTMGKLAKAYPAIRLSVRMFKSIVWCLINGLNVDKWAGSEEYTDKVETSSPDNTGKGILNETKSTKHQFKADAFKKGAEALNVIVDTFSSFVSKVGIRFVLKCKLLSKFYDTIENGVLAFELIVIDLVRGMTEALKEIPKEWYENPEDKSNPFNIFSTIVGSFIGVIGKLALIGTLGIVLLPLAATGLAMFGVTVMALTGICSIIDKVDWKKAHEGVKHARGIVGSIILMVAEMALIGIVVAFAYKPILIGFAGVVAIIGVMYLVCKLLASKTFKKVAGETIKSALLMALTIAALAGAVCLMALAGQLILKSISAVFMGLGATIVMMIILTASLYLMSTIIQKMSPDIFKGLIAFIAMATVLLAAAGIMLVLAMILSKWTPDDTWHVLGFMGAMLGMGVLFAGIGFVAMYALPFLIITALVYPAMALSLTISALALWGLVTILNKLGDWYTPTLNFVTQMTEIVAEMASWKIWRLPLVLLAGASMIATVGVLLISALAVKGLDKILSEMKWGVIDEKDFGHRYFNGGTTNEHMSNILYLMKQTVNAVNDIFGSWTVFGDLFSSVSTIMNSGAIMTTLAPIFAMTEIVEKVSKIDENKFKLAYAHMQDMFAWFFGSEAVNSAADKNGAKKTDVKSVGMARIIMDVMSSYSDSMSYHNSFLSSINPFASSDQELVADALNTALDPIDTLVDIIKDVSQIDQSKFKFAMAKVMDICNWFFGTKTVKSIADANGVSFKTEDQTVGMATIIMEILNQSQPKYGSVFEKLYGSICPWSDTDQEKVGQALNTALEPIRTLVSIIGDITKIDTKTFADAYSKVKDICNWYFGNGEQTGIVTHVIKAIGDATNNMDANRSILGSLCPFIKSDEEKVVGMLKDAIEPLNTMVDIIVKIADQGNEWDKKAEFAFGKMDSLIDNYVGIVNKFAGKDTSTAEKGTIFGFGETDLEKNSRVVKTSAEPINTLIDIFTGFGKIEWAKIKEANNKMNSMITRTRGMFKNLGTLYTDILTNAKVMGGVNTVKNVQDYWKGTVDALNDLDESKAEKLTKMFEAMADFGKQWKGSLQEFVDAMCDPDKGLIAQLCELNDNLTQVYVEGPMSTRGSVEAETSSPASAAPSQTTPGKPATPTNPATGKADKNAVMAAKISNQIGELISQIESLKNGIPVMNKRGSEFYVKSQD